jgi:hypothetical protein
MEKYLHENRGEDESTEERNHKKKMMEEKELKIKKLQSIIAQAVTSIHRVAFQLKEVLV